MSNNSQLEKEFVPYEESLELKELGFNEPCFGEYRQWNGCRLWLQIYQDGEGAESSFTTECKAPIFSQAFRWFREKYNLIGGVEYIAGTKSETTWWDVYVIGHFNTNTSKMTMKYQPYEEAELACLRKLIEIVKESHK